MASQVHSFGERKKRLLVKSHTSMGRLGSAAFCSAAGLGVGQLGFETHESRDCWTASTYKDLGSMDIPEPIQKPCPSHGSIVPGPPRKVLEPEARRRTLRQKLYSFVVATAILAL